MKRLLFKLLTLLFIGALLPSCKDVETVKFIGHYYGTNSVDMRNFFDINVKYQSNIAAEKTEDISTKGNFYSDTLRCSSVPVHTECLITFQRKSKTPVIKDRVYFFKTDLNFLGSFALLSTDIGLFKVEPQSNATAISRNDYIEKYCTASDIEATLSKIEATTLRIVLDIDDKETIR